MNLATVTAPVNDVEGLSKIKPSNGYDPIVALVQPTNDTYTVSFTAVDNQAVAASPTAGSNTIDFKIMITDLIQQNQDFDGSWKTVALTVEPFDMNGIVRDTITDVDKSAKFEIPFSANGQYQGGFPVRLVIGFKMTKNDGSDEYIGTFTVRRPSNNN